MFIKYFAEQINLLFFFLTKKKIIFINTPLQFLNFLELQNLKIFKREENEKILFITNSTNTNFLKIQNIKNFYNLKDYKIFNANYYFAKFLMIISLIIRRIINNKISFLIIGNYANSFFLRFSVISKKIFILDDGTNIFDESNKKIFEKKNVIFFTFFNKKSRLVPQQCN